MNTNQKGTTLSVSTQVPETHDEAGFSALEYTEISETAQLFIVSTPERQQHHEYFLEMIQHGVEADQAYEYASLLLELPERMGDTVQRLTDTLSGRALVWAAKYALNDKDPFGLPSLPSTLVSKGVDASLFADLVDMFHPALEKTDKGGYMATLPSAAYGYCRDGNPRVAMARAAVKEVLGILVEVPGELVEVEDA